MCQTNFVTKFSVQSIFLLNSQNKKGCTSRCVQKKQDHRVALLLKIQNNNSYYLKILPNCFVNNPEKRDEKCIYIPFYSLSSFPFSVSCSFSNCLFFSLFISILVYHANRITKISVL